MKKILLIAFMLVSLLSSAQTEKQRLVIWQKDGQKIYYELADEPVTTFANGLLIITSNKVCVEYKRSNILRYTYEGEKTNIETTVFNGMGFKQNDNDIYVYGVVQGSAAKLYNTSGVLLETQTTDGLNQLHFSLQNRPAGTYIINVGDQNLKFLKR